MASEPIALAPAKQTPAHFAAEFLADEGNIAPGARENAKLIWAGLLGFLGQIETLWEVIPIVEELKRRITVGEMVEVGPAGREDLVGIAQAYRVLLKEYPPCSDPACGQAICITKREGLDRVGKTLERIGIT